MPTPTPPPAPVRDLGTSDQPPSDTGRIARWGLLGLTLGFGGFLAWAAWAPLDEGVPATAQVAVDTKRKAVQHLAGGIVRQVLVREGDVVRQDQPLMLLDEAVARATHEQVRQRYLGLRAIQGRLHAEQAGAPSIVFHPDLVSASSDPLIRSQMQLQSQLLATRRAALQADLEGIEESVRAQQASMQAYDAMLTHRRQQLSLLEDELRHARGLVADGYMPRNRQLELERSVAEVRATIAELIGNTGRGARMIGELKQRAIARRQEVRKEVETQLADASRDVLAEYEKLVAVRNDLSRTEIRSPAAGQVVGLAVQTVGGVVQAGQKLMDIVPEGEPLLLEARIPPHLADRIGAGSPTDIRFAAFAHTPQLVVDGEILSVSADLLTDPQTGASWYLARVRVTEAGIRTLGERRMQPGMPAEVIVRTGERSMLAYLVHPLTKRLASAMKEE